MKLEIEMLRWPSNQSDSVIDIPRAEFGLGLHILWGISGSGKTSFMECLAGRRELTQGHIQYGPVEVDLAIERHRDRWFKQFLSMSFQESYLLPELSCEENIWLSSRLRGVEKPPISLFEEVTQVLRLEELLNKTPDKLSRGQQQRVSLARAILFSQEILLLDEPLVYIEKELGNQIFEFILKRVKDASLICLLSTHDPKIGADERISSKLEFPSR